MKVLFFLFLAMSMGMMLSCDSSGEKDTISYILAVSPDSLQRIYPQGEALTSDTIKESDPIRVYGKAVQRYASAMFFVSEQDPKNKIAPDGIQILDVNGNPVVLKISQEQKDSVLMDFIKFARRSQIPYHETVKDFELKLMKIR